MNSPGEVVVIRDIWNSKIWVALPMITVQDTPDLLALFRPAGTTSKRRCSLTGGEVTARERKNGSWSLCDFSLNDLELLRLTIPGENYSILLFWTHPLREFKLWYINLEDPQRRTRLGFDYTDRILDLIVEPNLKDWRWDDEGELHEAIELEMISHEKADELYETGGRIRDYIMSGESVFNSWVHWRPDPKWGIPILPDGWDSF